MRRKPSTIWPIGSAYWPAAGREIEPRLLRDHVAHLEEQSVGCGPLVQWLVERLIALPCGGHVPRGNNRLIRRVGNLERHAIKVIELQQLGQLRQQLDFLDARRPPANRKDFRPVLLGLGGKLVPRHLRLPPALDVVQPEPRIVKENLRQHFLLARTQRLAAEEARELAGPNVVSLQNLRRSRRRTQHRLARPRRLHPRKLPESFRFRL
jgi:hypothetical protein